MKKIVIILCILYLFLGNITTFAQETSPKKSPAAADTFEDGAQQIIGELDYKDTDIRDIIRSIATKYNINIFIDNSISKKLSLHFTNIKVQDFIEFIVEENNLRLTQKDSIYKIFPPKPAPVIPKKIDVKVKNGLLTVDLKNDKLDMAIRAIAKESGKTILLDKQAGGSLSGFLQNVPFEIGLRQLLENNGFKLEKNQNIYVVRKDIYFFQQGDKKEGRSQGPLYINVQDSLISLDVRNASLNQIVQEASRRLEKNIFIYGKIDGTISARADSLTFLELLDFIFKGSDYTYKLQNGVILIGNKSVKGISTSELIKLNYLKADKIVELLPQSIKSKSEIKPIIELNGIMVIGTRSVINEVKDYISKIDRPSPQILIEILVIDINDSKIREISFDAGYGNYTNTDTSGSKLDFILPGIDILLNSKDVNNFLDKAGNLFGISKIGKLPDDFFLKIKALETSGVLQVRSRPQIATLNGYPADISIGLTQYFKMVTKTPFRDPSQVYVSETETFTQIDANITLKIIPWVSGSGEITVEIHPQFSTPVGSLSPDIPPTIQTRELNSTVRLRDGETIVLGGLVQNSIERSTSGVPILSSLPIIGNLFKSHNYNKSQNELIIYVTPHLYYGDE
jgi:type IV pilus assembly protein PilQ